MPTRRRRAKDTNTSPRLEAWIASTQTALDLFALLTLWIVMIPLSSLGDGPDITAGGLALRIGLSAVFAVDFGVRTALAPHHWRYFRSHPVGLLAVIVPPVRVLFSLRLVASLFRRGHLDRFLFAAGLLLFNGILIVYFYERHAPGANITTVGDAIWWGIVTISTVGYGDDFPVTTGGRIVASGIMAMGVITIAVVTAQVSVAISTQSSEPDLDDADVPDRPLRGGRRGVAELHDRLDKIEAMLAAQSTSSDDPPSEPSSRS